jgi:hypothetical protein
MHGVNRDRRSRIERPSRDYSGLWVRALVLAIIVGGIAFGYSMVAEDLRANGPALPAPSEGAPYYQAAPSPSPGGEGGRMEEQVEVPPADTTGDETPTDDTGTGDGR